MSAPVTPPEVSAENQNLAAQMRPALVKYFRRKTGNTAEAEDLAQDVLVRALGHAHWTSPSQAKGYIFRAAINRWRDRRRRVGTWGQSVTWEDAEDEIEGAENTPERVLMLQEEIVQVVRALESMNERTRAVLMLIKLEQMKVAAVAGMLGISVSAVNKHLARALARLAELRRPEDGT
jgi:RNA polymerase sigma factor (sigma-70 family)